MTNYDFGDNQLKESIAVIISGTIDGELICAASARISTTQGTALNVLQQSKLCDNNRQLVKKVVSSGHKSLIEHYVFNLAFNNVSAIVEQFIIEFRLASFTVQSRRYVDFRDVGFYIPKDLSAELRNEYCDHMNGLFLIYQKLLQLGIPKEDARFMLPYSFKSNFFCTCNARELMHIICSMIYGRGKSNIELLELGINLKTQFEQYLPDLIKAESVHYLNNDERYKYNQEFPRYINQPKEVSATVELISAAVNPESQLDEAYKYNFCINEKVNNVNNVINIILSERPRELELLNYSFKINNLTLSAITHLTRHRMQNLLVPHISNAIRNNRHIVPQSILAIDEAMNIYCEAFRSNTNTLNRLLSMQMPIEYIEYFSLSGHTLNVISSMNARELLHYFNLRTCNRAQWEIKDISLDMIKLLRQSSFSIFKHFGPSCFTKGFCPEGKMSCGEISQVRELYSEMSLL